MRRSKVMRGVGVRGRASILVGGVLGLAAGSDVAMADPFPANLVINTRNMRAVEGDFNGDNASDLALGNLYDAAETGTGALEVIYGATNGIWSFPADATWDRDDAGMLESASSGDAFGSALAVGDFNNDGYDDLAIGVPGDDVAADSNGGSVHVMYGSSTGLTASGNQVFHQDTSGIPGAVETGDTFGEALAAGDFNCDGYADLAVGAPREDIGSITDAGWVTVINGSSTGLSAASSAEWHQDVTGVEGACQAGDYFGAALAAGNIDGNSHSAHACDDLAIGLPGQDVGSATDAGLVQIIMSDSAGLRTSDDLLMNQDVASVDDVAETDDGFGLRVWIREMTGDSYPDLLAYVPGEAIVAGGSTLPGRHRFNGSSTGVTVTDALSGWSEPSGGDYTCGSTGSGATHYDVCTDCIERCFSDATNVSVQFDCDNTGACHGGTCSDGAG